MLSSSHILFFSSRWERLYSIGFPHEPQVARHIKWRRPQCLHLVPEPMLRISPTSDVRARCELTIPSRGRSVFMTLLWSNFTSDTTPCFCERDMSSKSIDLTSNPIHIPHAQQYVTKIYKLPKTVNGSEAIKLVVVTPVSVPTSDSIAAVSVARSENSFGE